MGDRKTSVLTVDGDPRWLQRLLALLEGAGYSIAACATGSEALNYVSRNKPDVVVSDARLPDIEGMELLEKTKQSSPRTHVILFSRSADWPEYVELLEKGGDDLLAKPSRDEEILTAVGKVAPTV